MSTQPSSAHHRRRSSFLAKILLCLSARSITSNGSHASRRPFRASLPFTTQPSSTTAAPWQSETYLSKKDWDNLKRYQNTPPTVFAPRGRLHSVERIMEALSSDKDPTSNLVVALQCRDGLVIVSSVNAPPNAGLFLPKEGKTGNTTTTTNTTSSPTSSKPHSLWLDYPGEADTAPWSHSSSCIMRIPFQENDNLFAVTAGNGLHGIALRHLIRKHSENIYKSNDDGIYTPYTPPPSTRISPSVALLARRLADHFQKPTQNSGRMLVSCALIVGANEGIWQIDPTGQFWQCQAAVVGRCADKARSYLLEKVAKDSSEVVGGKEGGEEKSDIETTHAQLKAFLSNLSIQDAAKVAAECIRHTLGKPASVGKDATIQSNETDTEPPPTMSQQQPLLAFAIRQSTGGEQELQWYRQRDFEDGELEGKGAVS